MVSKMGQAVPSCCGQDSTELYGPPCFMDVAILYNCRSCLLRLGMLGVLGAVPGALLAGSSFASLAKLAEPKLVAATDGPFLAELLHRSVAYIRLTKAASPRAPQTQREERDEERSKGDKYCSDRKAAGSAVQPRLGFCRAGGAYEN